MAGRAEGRGIVEGGGAEEADAEEEGGPDVPEAPLRAEAAGMERSEVAERKEAKREEPGKDAMEAWADAAKDVAAVKLAGGEEIERSGEEADPGRAANGREEKRIGVDAGMEDGVEEVEKKRSAEEDVGLRGVGMGERGNDGGVKHAVEQRGNGEEKADDGAGSADVKEGAGGANGRTNEDEGAEGADEAGKRDKEWIGGVNVMAAAGEEMAEFVGEENGEEREREGQAGEKTGGIFVQEREGAEEFVDGGGLLVGVGDGELRASDKAGGEGAEKKRDGQ